MSKILLVDDDQELTSAVQNFLVLQGHSVETASTGEDAIQLLTNFQYDVIVLDWGLPGIEGDELCRLYRSRGGSTPILFLTGRNNISFLESGFNSGADDYMVKPFDIRELSARIKGLLRRVSSQFVENLKIGGVELLPEQRIARADGKEIKLRAKESALLEYLMRHPDKTFTAQNLLDAVWTADSNGTTNSVRTWMGTLRQQLAKIGKEDLVKTVLGSGYKVESAE
ncbi:MAG: response regulator transcription factor [Candidatus Obscuribacterales bacterium]|nr:response regulator transcription factor [Candidatus Obscuribacterales bacterium]